MREIQVLELKPLKNKKLKLVLVESEFPIDWSVEMPNTEEGVVDGLFFISRQYMDFIEKLVVKYKPDFVVEDKGMRTNEPSIEDEDDEFLKIFKKRKIPYKLVGIPDYALNYLVSPINNKKDLLKKFTAEIENYKNRGQVHYNDPHFQQLVIWRQYLKHDYKEEEALLKFKVRESWMMMGILELAKQSEKSTLTSLFICDKSHFDGIIFLADELNIDYELMNIKKITKGLSEVNSVDDVLKSSVLEIMPIKLKKKDKEEKILYFFDTDDYCSPFDTNMGYDAGFDVVIPYSKISADHVTKLVQDAMFSRKIGAPTVYFVGGSNVEEADKIAQKVLEAIVPPFESPVIIDPRGAHTTGSAIVIKTLEVAKKHGINDLNGRKVAILGGTGPVGQISAMIASKLGANVIITSRREDSAKKLAAELTEKAGVDAIKIQGVAANTEEDYFKITKDADIIWSVGKAGIQMISTNVLKKYNNTKIIVDINLVPPYGIEGMNPNFNDEEFLPGVFGIGALDIGRLKYKIESSLFKMATQIKGKKILDYSSAFDVAKEIVFGEKINISI